MTLSQVMFPCELSASSLFTVIHCAWQLLEQAQLDQSSYFWKQCFKLPWATVSLFSRDEAGRNPQIYKSWNIYDEIEWCWYFRRIFAFFPWPSSETKLMGGHCIPLASSKQEICIYFWEQLLRPTHAWFPWSVWRHLFPRDLCIHASWVIFICHVGAPRSSVRFPGTRFALWKRARYWENQQRYDSKR